MSGTTDSTLSYQAVFWSGRKRFGVQMQQLTEYIAVMVKYGKLAFL